jgi:putative endonuclease
MKTDAFFMYFVYILYSEKCNRYYIGYSEEIQARLDRHNRGMVAATKNCRPYIIKASKPFATEIEARKEESRLKKQKAGSILNGLFKVIGRHAPI